MGLHLMIAENVLDDQNYYDLLKNTFALAFVATHWNRVVVDGLEAKKSDGTQSDATAHKIIREVNAIEHSPSISARKS